MSHEINCAVFAILSVRATGQSADIPQQPDESGYQKFWSCTVA
jgi:hypothetical protein